MMEHPAQAQEPSLHELRVNFPDTDVLCTSNGMNYAKHEGVIIAADPSRSELRDQIQEYFDNTEVCVWCKAKIRRTGDLWLLATAADINGYCSRGPDDMHQPDGRENE
jgi:hypothetical protein